MTRHTEKKEDKVEKADKKDKKNGKSIMNLVVFALIIVAFMSFIVYSVVSKSGGESPDKVAQCLSEKGAILYASQYCPHCQEQKKLFGNAISKIEMVECSSQIERCQEAGITAYPTWVINGRKFLGTKDMKTLYDIADCSN